MIEDRVERYFQILRRRLVRRQDDAVQDRLGVRLVMARDVDHRVAPTQRGRAGEENRVRRSGLRVGPAGQDRRGSENCTLIISRDRESARA